MQKEDILRRLNKKSKQQKYINYCRIVDIIEIIENYIKCKLREQEMIMINENIKNIQNNLVFNRVRYWMIIIKKLTYINCMICIMVEL